MANAKPKKPNHQADIKNKNGGTSGINETFKKAHANTQRQKAAAKKTK